MRDFNLDQALDLIRKLPLDDDSQQLVSQVVRTTLESVGVDLAQIASEGRQRGAELSERAQAIESEIAGLERRILELRERLSEIDLQMTDVDRFMNRFLERHNREVAETLPSAGAEVPADAET